MRLLLLMMLSAVVTGCGTHPLYGPCFSYETNCKPQAEWDAIREAEQAKRDQQAEVDRQRNEKREAQEAESRARARQWQRENPERARQAWREMQRELNNLNIYGCPGNMIPRGTGCGYWIGL